MAVRVIRLVGREVTGIDFAPVAVRAGARRCARTLEELDGRPPVERRRPEALRRSCPDDPGDRRRVIGEQKRLVLVVLEAFHILLLSRTYELRLTTRTTSGF